MHRIARCVLPFLIHGCVVLVPFTGFYRRDPDADGLSYTEICGQKARIIADEAGWHMECASKHYTPKEGEENKDFHELYTYSYDTQKTRSRPLKDVPSMGWEAKGGEDPLPTASPFLANERARIRKKQADAIAANDAPPEDKRASDARDKDEKKLKRKETVVQPLKKKDRTSSMAAHELGTALSLMSNKSNKSNKSRKKKKDKKGKEKDTDKEKHESTLRRKAESKRITMEGGMPHFRAMESDAAGADMAARVLEHPVSQWL